MAQSSPHASCRRPIIRIKHSKSMRQKGRDTYDRYIRKARRGAPLLAALMLSGTALADVSKPATKGGVSEDKSETEVQTSDAQEDTGYSLLFTNNPVPDIAERCLPSVVGVINMVSTFDFDSRKTNDEEYAYGSGVVIDDDGHIITNAHVVQGADKVKVLLVDDSELEAEIVGTDTDSDLAVLYVEGLNQPAIALGDSEKLRVGDLLIAIGNPGGYYGSVSVGVVSALERDIVQFGAPHADNQGSTRP